MNIISEKELKRRLKISKTMKGRRPKAAILANTGKACSEVTRNKISLANKGKGSRCRKKEYHHSKETIEKIRKSNTGRKTSSKTRLKQSLIKLQNPVKYWLGRKRSIETIEKIKRSKKGCISPRKGAILTKETKNKIRKGRVGKKATAKQKENYRMAALKRWKNPEYCKKVLAVNLPNKAEKILQSLLDKNSNIKYEYVGDGKMRVERKIPDFVNKENNKIIELFGEQFHERKEEKERKDLYRKYGYDTLIIWSKDLFRNQNEMINNIKEFSKK